MTCGACGSAVDPRRTFCACGAANVPALASVGISHDATPSRPWRKGTHDRSPMNSWHRGVAVSHRPDGSVMPFLDERGERIGVKAWGETYRRKFQEQGLA